MKQEGGQQQRPHKELALTPLYRFTQHGLLIGFNSVTTFTLGLAARSADSDVITLPSTSLLYLRSYLSLARFILNSYVSCGWGLTCRQYFNLVGNEDETGSERFKWSRASTFSYNRNAIGLAVAKLVMYSKISCVLY